MNSRTTMVSCRATPVNTHLLPVIVFNTPVTPTISSVTLSSNICQQIVNCCYYRDRVIQASPTHNKRPQPADVLSHCTVDYTHTTIDNTIRYSDQPYHPYAHCTCDERLQHTTPSINQ